MVVASRAAAEMASPIAAPSSPLANSSIWLRAYKVSEYWCVVPSGGQGPVKPMAPVEFLA